MLEKEQIPKFVLKMQANLQESAQAKQAEQGEEAEIAEKIDTIRVIFGGILCKTADGSKWRISADGSIVEKV